MRGESHPETSLKVTSRISLCKLSENPEKLVWDFRTLSLNPDTSEYNVNAVPNVLPVFVLLFP